MIKGIISLVFVGIVFFGKTQTKKYPAITTAMFNDYAGYVYVNLTGENKGLIRIDGKGIGDSILSKLLNMPDKELKTFKVNAALVSKIIIGNDTFYRQDLLDTYEKDGNKKENCYLKKIYGKNDVQLYEWKDSHNQFQYYFKLPQEETLQNLNHPYYQEWNSDFFYGFEKCKILRGKFTNEYHDDKTKFPFYNLTKVDEKIVAWKKLIDEYDGCDLVMKK